MAGFHWPTHVFQPTHRSRLQHTEQSAFSLTNLSSRSWHHRGEAHKQAPGSSKTLETSQSRGNLTCSGRWCCLVGIPAASYCTSFAQISPHSKRDQASRSQEQADILFRRSKTFLFLSLATKGEKKQPPGNRGVVLHNSLSPKKRHSNRILSVLNVQGAGPRPCGGSVWDLSLRVPWQVLPKFLEAMPVLSPYSVERSL